MKILRVAFLTSLLCVLPGLRQVALADDPALLVSASAVSIYEYETNAAGVVLNEPQAVCSGFVVARTGTTETIITARHCVVDLPEDHGDHGHVTSIHFIDGDRGDPSTIIISKDYDLAEIIVTTTYPHIPIEVTPQPITRNEDLYVFGAPLGEEWSLARAYSMQGNVENIDSDPQGNPIRDLEIDCGGCAPGMSGAAVINPQGKVVGVLVLSSAIGPGGGAPSSQHWMVPAEQVIKFMAEANAAYHPIKVTTQAKPSTPLHSPTANDTLHRTLLIGTGAVIALLVWLFRKDLET